MPYGWMGTTLDIDLTQGRIEKRATDSEFSRMCLGSKGVNTRLFWDKPGPDSELFAPENPLIVSPGLPTGTLVPAAKKGFISIKSPVTGLFMLLALGDSGRLKSSMPAMIS